MEGPPRLRRSKSLKTALSPRTRRDSVLDNEEALPPPRPAKPTLIQLHVASDDTNPRPPSAGDRLRPSASLAVPSPRNTWPQGLRERRPGTYAFNEIPTLTKTPWEQNRALRSAPKRSQSTTRSSHINQTFSRLPREILHCVLDHLKDLHRTKSQLDVTGHRAALAGLCVANKQWHRVAREHLYREIWLPWNGAAGAQRRGGHHSRSTHRLNLLLRTLQEAPGLAHLVKRLCIPSSMTYKLDCELFLDSGVSESPSRLIIPTLCAIIRKCANLQSLSGHHFLALDRTTDFLRALASRHELREHVWILPPSASDWRELVLPGAFVDGHAQWRQLETLVLYREGTKSELLGPGTVTALLQRLPSLKHLFIQGLSRAEFHNGTVLMLPPLKSLRLEELPGITDHGLQQLVHSRIAMSLENLFLVGLELTSLRTVQSLLDNLPRLKRFSLMQKTSLELHEAFNFTGSSFSLASTTLERLHWNTLLPGNATAILANAIAAGKFPRLRSVKVPCDDDGAIQKLCRPIQQRSITGDEARTHVETLNARSAGLEYRKTAKFLEMEAQLRAKRARKDSVFSVTVEDEEGVEQFQWVGSYLGSIASRIEYLIEPDVEGAPFAHARMEDLHRLPKEEGGLEQVVGSDVLF